MADWDEGLGEGRRVPPFSASVLAGPHGASARQPRSLTLTIIFNRIPGHDQQFGLRTDPGVRDAALRSASVAPSGIACGPSHKDGGVFRKRRGVTRILWQSNQRRGVFTKHTLQTHFPCALVLLPLPLSTSLRFMAIVHAITRAPTRGQGSPPAVLGLKHAIWRLSLWSACV
jgi:hypothetical protein